MKLLTDGTEKSLILGFCLNVVSRHMENWPPQEEVLAEELVQWLGFSSFLPKEALMELCRAKGVDLTFEDLPLGLRGFNCSYRNQKKIVLTNLETASFSETHTLFHEFREMLEHVFTELGHPTIGAEQNLEVQAEHFAMACRVNAVGNELPAFFKLAQGVEKPWMRYLAYLLVVLFGAALIYSCVLVPQMEEILAEAKRNRYVRT